ncbi:MAG: FAD-binding oxidoreductase, partial [Candidatus Eisenbacteria bacterium]|nr:FAD-binding oxidoreductase [Candidatus Eisenbacteria bacterium]
MNRERELAPRLADVVGAEHVASPASSFGESAEWPASMSDAAAWSPLLVRPGSIEEVSRLVAACADVEATVVPIGSGSSIRAAIGPEVRARDAGTEPIGPDIGTHDTGIEPIGPDIGTNDGGIEPSGPDIGTHDAGIEPSTSDPADSWPGLARALRRLTAEDRPLPDVLLSLERLDRVVEHNPADMVASVECGAPWHGTQTRLGERGQWIPLDPSISARSTVGGVLAMNRFGPRRLRDGTLRDWVIGTTLVRPDGDIVRAGGMVVKNVSGYDLSKLYLGSHGSLGILV